MTNTTPGDKRVNLDTRLQWVPLDKMRVSPAGEGQRELKQYRVDKLISAGFEPDIMGYPEVSERDGHFYIVDGQARVGALKQWLGDWKGQQIQCRVHHGLTVAQECELFLRLNDFTVVPAMPKFQNAVGAGRPDESDIDRIIRASGLTISHDGGETSVGCVGTLTRVYKRAGGVVMGRGVRIARDAYGKPGLEAAVIDGLSLLCQRYNGELDADTAVAKLSKAYGGVNGLLGKAEQLRRQTGNDRNACIAAAAVTIINSGKGGKKLPDWWKS